MELVSTTGGTLDLLSMISVMHMEAQSAVPERDFSELKDCVTSLHGLVAKSGVPGSQPQLSSYRGRYSNVSHDLCDLATAEIVEYEDVSFVRPCCPLPPAS